MSGFVTVELFAAAALVQAQQRRLLTGRVCKNNNGDQLCLVPLSALGAGESEGELAILTASINGSNLLQERIAKVAMHHWCSPLLC
jgi:hypothetical protein